MTREIECDKISLLEEDLDSRISLKAEYQKEFSVLEKTLELLKEAKDNLSSNYLNPMIASLNKYLKEIDKEFSNINLDINLDPMFTESGELKEISYLSAGYQDLVSICIRLALVENIYKNEKPLLILDDPFVNLDSEKLEKAKRLLNSISNDYQVLYMVCHDSRV